VVEGAGGLYAQFAEIGKDNGKAGALTPANPENTDTGVDATVKLILPRTT